MICAAERSQLATISGRTPARMALVGRLSQIAGMCRSQARARCERRRCNCARVNMIKPQKAGYCPQAVNGHAALLTGRITRRKGLKARKIVDIGPATEPPSTRALRRSGRDAGHV